MQSVSIATGGTGGTADGNSISTGGVYTSIGGTNLPEETGSVAPNRLTTQGNIATTTVPLSSKKVNRNTSVNVLTRGHTIQGPQPPPEPAEGYNPPRRVWSDIHKGTVEIILKSAREGDLGFEDQHDSILFLDDNQGKIARLQRPDADRFRDLLNDDYFQTILNDDFEDAVDIALTRFSSFSD